MLAPSQPCEFYSSCFRQSREIHYRWLGGSVITQDARPEVSRAANRVRPVTEEFLRGITDMQLG